MTASMRQDFLYSPPLTPPVGYPPLPPPNSTPQRGDSKMNASTAQRYPPSSTSSMKNRSPSVASSTSNKSVSPNLKEQYDALKAYLEDHIAKEIQNGANPQRTGPRERLHRLNTLQFLELSTDVFDELIRKNLSDPNVTYLPPQADFASKRNLARQKLSALSEARFKDLASDIFYDLDKRHPELGEQKAPADFKRPPLPPMPNADSPTPPSYPARKDSAPAANAMTNTTTIVPTKSTVAYEPVDYKIQTGVPSMPPAPHRPDLNSSRGNGPPLPPIPRGGSPAERNRAANGMSVASNSSAYTTSSSRSSPTRRDTNQSEKSKPVPPRTPPPNLPPPASDTPSVSPVNFNSLNNLMADLGSMIKTKSNGSQPPSPATELPSVPNVFKTSNGSSTNLNGDRERDRAETLRDASTKKEREHDPSNARNPPKKPGVDPDEVEKMKAEYESKIDGLKKQTAQLETELEAKLKQPLESHRMQELEDEVSEYKKLMQSQTLELTQLQQRYERLDDEYHKLEDEHHQQQQLVNNVRTEATSLLEEIKELTKRTDDFSLEKEQALEKLRTMEEESKSWQAKYEKTKIELRNLKATSSFVREPPKIDVFNENQLRPVPDGAVEQARVVEYQASIDDLLRAGRSETPSSVLMAMKSIVLSCKLITIDVERFEANPPTSHKDDSRGKLYALKAKFSSTLTNLMTAAKAHATGMGISPVSLLDAAASHLTISVVDIVKFVGMRKSRPEDEERWLEDQNRRKETAAASKAISGGAGYANGGNSANSSRHSIANRSSLSMGGAWSGKDMGGNPNGRSGTDRNDELQPAELKVFLERQTETIVQSIQTFLATFRTPSDKSDITPSVDSITSVVSNIISTSRATFALPQSSPYRLKGEAVLRDLEASVDKLLSCHENLRKGEDTKLAKGKLANVSFDIAKFTKELMGIL